MNGPTRTQIQRSGDYNVIGPAPKSAPEPTSASYKAAKAAKIARDRQLVAAREGYRRRSAAPTKPRSRGDALRNGSANGDMGPFNGVVTYNGEGSAAASAGAGDWWMNPWLWAALAGLFLVTRKGKK